MNIDRNSVQFSQNIEQSEMKMLKTNQRANFCVRDNREMQKPVSVSERPMYLGRSDD